MPLASHAAWLMEQDAEYRVEETDPKPSEAVRRMFKAGFMPLGIALEESEEMECGKEMCVRDDDVTYALMLDPRLLPAVINNGKPLKHQRSTG